MKKKKIVKKYPRGLFKEVAKATNISYNAVRYYAKGNGSDKQKETLVLEAIEKLLSSYHERQKQATERIKELLQ